MLRDEKQVALNEVIVVCRDVADRYRDAAEMLDDTELARLFRTFADERRTMSRELETHIRRLGDLPRVPDADREMVESVITRVKSALSEDERIPLLEQCEKDEQAVAERLAEARRQDLPKETRILLDRFGEQVAAARQRLAAHKAAI